MSHYFFAIPLPDSVKAYIHELSDPLKAHFNYGYWTGPEDYHITLFFMGEVDGEKLNKIREGIREKTREVSRIELQLKGFGTFGKKDAPRVLWMGVQAGGNLNQSQSVVTSCLIENGFEAEKRPYRPHITIAKKWRGASIVLPSEWEKVIPAHEPTPWTASDFSLFEVRPKEVPRYVQIESFPLV